MVIEWLEEQNIKTMRHSAYSPDLSPRDFWPNPYIKARTPFLKPSRHGLRAVPVS